jgi:hypothetical protein
MDVSDSETVVLRPGVLGPAVDCPVRWCRSARARRVSLRIDARAGEVVVTLPTVTLVVAGLAPALKEDAEYVPAAQKPAHAAVG